MATRQNTVLLKRSNVIGKLPPLSGLTLGEMALNTADAKLYSLYTSGTTGATEVRQIGWDRISRTGDTVTGDFNIFGDVAISGSSLPSGYTLSVTGDTDIVGDLYVEGNIDYDGNLIVSGSAVFQSGITANTIYTDYIDFNTGATVAQSVGRINWDSGTGTLNISVGDSGTGLIDLQVGQEEIVRVYNSEATTLVKGEIVYVSGSQGNRPAVKRAVATSDGYSVTTLGMVDRNITSGSEGYVTTFGVISNLNTLGLTGGTPIWLSGTVPGGYTSTKPIAPLHTVLIGYVVRVSATVGSIFVNISNGWELDEIHDVRISGVTEGDLLMRSSFSGTPVWVNTKTLLGSYTITGNTNIGGNLTVSGTTYLQGLSATTISATTIGTSGDCVDDIYVSNIHSCSPLNINPLDEGNVYFGSTSGVTIDLSNDRVGIGTSTPSTLLHVVGSYTGGTDALIPQMLFQNSNTVPNTNKTAIIRTTVGSGYVAGGYPEIWLESQETSTGVGLTKLRTVSNHPLLFYTNDIERGRFGHTGNFGLNTQSPAGILHARTGLNKNIIFTSGSTRNLIRSLIDGNSDYVGLEIDTLDLNIKTNGVDRMIINSSGDTGIGTITPTAKLHINNTTSGNTFLAEDNTNPDSTPFVIDASGNTGIGIVTPTVKLHLSGNSIFEQSKLTINQKDGIVGIDIVNSGESMYQLSNSITDWCIVGKTPSEFYFYNSLNVPIRFYTNASEKMTVLGNGNVGIGITSPTAKVHINNTTSGNTFLAEDDTNPDSTPFLIDASGNTGIGTLSPREKLDVSGNTIISSGLTATTINVPPLADDKIVYTTNNGRLTTTSAFTYNQSNNTFSVNNIDANGNFNITGNTTQSGNTFQNGNLNITGNTNQIGNFTITGNTTQSGNTTQYGNIDLTGNTTQIGSVTLSGNTFITGNTDQIGNVNITGDTVIDGSLSADTITITNTPTLNNTLFQILGRNESTGDVEYRQVNTIGNNVTILTGGTYSAQTTIDNVIGVDTTLTTTTIYLPDSVSSGRLRFEIKDIGLNAYNNPITIIAAGTDTIISYTNSQTLIMESEGGAIILLNTGLGQWWQM